MIGELLAGVILGPSLLGWIEPTETLPLLAEIGIILLLFEVGLETDVRSLARSGGNSAYVALAGFTFPFLLGFGVARWLLAMDLLPALFIGGTATSIGITVQVLADLLYEFSVAGGVSMVNAGKMLVFVALFFMLAAPAAKLIAAIIKRNDAVSETPGLLPTTLVSPGLFFAWLAHAVGAPEPLGGFAAGLALSRRFDSPAPAKGSSKQTT